MTIECDKCKHENPDNSRYCGRCGEQLPLEAAGPLTINERDAQEQTQVFVNQFADSIKLVAAQTKFDELKDFQDRATRWVRIQFITATTAISLLLAFMAWLGYNGWNLNEKFQQDLAQGKADITSIKDGYQVDVDKKLQAMDEVKNKYLEEYRRNLDIVADSRSQLKSISQQVTSEAGDALGQITAKQVEFKKLDFSQVKLYRQELEEKIASVNRLEKKLGGQLLKLEDQRLKLDKIERSRYQILVHYDGTDLEQSEPSNFSELQTALYDKGYIVDYEDIMNVSADRQEILYYSATADMESKVEEIIDLISPKVDGEVGKKLERSGNNDPFQIVIKLCPKGTTGGLSCKL